MSMTASEIAAVVGTEQKAWWPEHVYHDGQGFYQELPMQGFASPYMLDGVAELAFIGAAVRELLRRDFNMMRHDDGAFTVWHTDRRINVERKCFLSALVAALNESEAA